MQSLERATDRVAAGQGELSVTGTLRGVEASVGYKPKSWLNLSGYAGRTWAGKAELGARASVTWGGK
jgi:hypothetical protein